MNYLTRIMVRDVPTIHIELFLELPKGPPVAFTRTLELFLLPCLPRLPSGLACLLPPLSVASRA